MRLVDALEAAYWHAFANAFRALAPAHDGNRLAASRQVGRSERALGDVEDEVVRFRVLQRLALVLSVSRISRAPGLAATSAQVCEGLVACRAAIGAGSIASAINHLVTADAGEALAYVRLRLDEVKAKDDASVRAALVANFEAAVPFVDAALFGQYRPALQRRLIPQQYSERL